MNKKQSYSEKFKGYEAVSKILNNESRQFKADKILAVINDYAEKQNINVADCNILDIGSGNGVIGSCISKKCNNVYGIEPDFNMINKNNIMYSNFKIISGSGTKIPFKNNFFDIIICNHVYEHVDSTENLFNEIHRILKHSGFAYIAAGNRYTFIEPHYRLPLLSWFPKKLADIYLKMFTSKKDYDVKLLSYNNIKKLFYKFKTIEYTSEVLFYPDKFNFSDIFLVSFFKFLPKFIFPMLQNIIPTFLFIIVKK